MVEEDLSTTTMSDLSPLAKFLLCLSSSVPLTKFHLAYRSVETPDAPVDIHFTKSFLKDAYAVLSERNSSILRNITSLCRTLPLATKTIEQCIPSKYSDVKELTCGGMSRIYSCRSAQDEAQVVIKTTDCSRGLGVHEYDSYQMLSRHAFPIPSIYYAATYSKYLILILSRHSFSLSSLLITLARRNSSYDSEMLETVLLNVTFLLQRLKESNITYCDFSPDNIMIDVDPESMTGRCILIDPQFAIHTTTLAKKLGANWADNIDRVHFAYKVRTLAINEPYMLPLARAVCTKMLGYVPSDKQTKRWILNVLPDGLRIAYDTMHTKKKSSRRLYGQKRECGCWCRRK